MTEREKKELKYKKTVLDLAKEHTRAGEKEREGRYYMPRDDEVIKCKLFCHKIILSSLIDSYTNFHRTSYNSELNRVPKYILSTKKLKGCLLNLL